MPAAARPIQGQPVPLRRTPGLRREEVRGHLFRLAGSSPTPPAGPVRRVRPYVGSTEFTEIWNASPVRAPGHRIKTIAHPWLGPLRVNCDVLTIPEDDQQVVFITADSGSPAARALRHLGAAG